MGASKGLTLYLLSTTVMEQWKHVHMTLFMQVMNIQMVFPQLFCTKQSSSQDRYQPPAYSHADFVYSYVTVMLVYPTVMLVDPTVMLIDPTVMLVDPTVVQWLLSMFHCFAGCSAVWCLQETSSKWDLQLPPSVPRPTLISIFPDPSNQHWWRSSLGLCVTCNYRRNDIQ